MPMEIDPSFRMPGLSWPRNELKLDNVHVLIFPTPHTCRSRWTVRGRDLSDADGPWFVALNGSFQAENRSLIGQTKAVIYTDRVDFR